MGESRAADAMERSRVQLYSLACRGALGKTVAAELCLTEAAHLSSQELQRGGR
jgi:hypothetical protein